ncbi:TPA: molecular chaperone FimC, partial [Escherichia coli]|nr:molecular chaperone FimC [Escherichia coli]
LKAGNKSLENTMVPPQGKVTVNIPGGYTGGDITYKTINDYGALTEQVRGVVK